MTYSLISTSPFRLQFLQRSSRLTQILAMGLVALIAAALWPAAARAQDMSFNAYLEVLKNQARSEGVRESTIRRMTAGLTPNPKVIALDRKQPGTPTRSGYPPLAPYIATHVDNARVNGGKRMLRNTYSLGRSAQRRYGVPPEIVMAIWGHETNYGSYMGDFDLARSLATLAWEGRRRQLFSRQFVDLLKIADRGFPRSEMVGSWAGAFGNPQFLPSVYLRLAVDGDGDGKSDIWRSRADTIASIANYFNDAGWRSDQPWGVAASVPAGFNWAAVKTKLNAPGCSRVHERHSQWKTVREWREMGVRPLRSLPDDTMTSLFQPDGPGKPAWLLTSNYRVILEYNCSNYYAMSVGLLADEIAQ